MRYGHEFDRHFAGLVLLLTAMFLFPLRVSNAQEEPAPFTDQQLEYFESKVRPLLVDRCYQCHGNDPESLEGGLSLVSRKSMLAGGDTGPAITPGEPTKSLMIDAINYGDVYEMPPDSKLPQEEINILTEWVRMGSPWPVASDVEVKAAEEFDIQARKSSHWCWQPIQSPALPNVEDSDWIRDPIDNFVLAKLESKNLKPSNVAEKRVLIRRLYFDLIGLPPTPQQIDSYLNDDSDEAYSTVVDELLESNRFGERWARHWMDLVRYAETTGHEFDYAIPHAYPYRDYLIRAFNEDVPYDQLIREHLAGDLLETPRQHGQEFYNESIIGTGFWFFHEGHHGPVDVKADEAKRIDNQIDVMTKTFLGLTVSCARCHDHKFDAISTKDFYSLYGFLKSSRRQDAMLDPGNKIENAFTKSVETAERANQLLAQLRESIKDPVEERIAKHLSAAIEKLRADPEWSKPPGTTIQGETLNLVNDVSGTTSTQEIEPRGNFSWQDNKQFFWHDGEIGDKAELEFEFNFAGEEKEFEIFLCLTRAKDYAKAKISLNEAVLHEEFDCFQRQLGTTGKRSFGTVVLQPGKQTLVLEITGHNEKAIERNMLGVDYLSFAPVERLADLKDKPARPNADPETDQDLVNRIATGISLDQLNLSTHPLNLLQKVSLGHLPVDERFFANFQAETLKQSNTSKRSLKQTELFADFKNGLPDGWFETGKAFGNSSSNLDSAVSMSGDMVADQGTVHSGIHHRNFQGVIRSPSFVLNHSKILYRVKGTKARIRLIIEGYQLDTFNALLFNGSTIDIPTTESYRWVAQAKDIENHKGRLAHIEIIDQAKGYISLDEIRFSNGPVPNDCPPKSSREFSSIKLKKDKGVAQVASYFAESVFGELSEQNGPESSTVMSWLVEHDLTDLLSNEHSNVSIGGRQNDRNTPREINKELLELRKSARNRNDIPTPRLAVAMTDGTPANEHVFIRGNHKALGPIVERNNLDALSNQPLRIRRGSGRLELANSIVSLNNPLTARVAVNRVWHHLLGRGIVRSVDNFGVLGQKPTHPLMLDHLATRFVEDGWSIKKLVRNIVHSQTYQLSSSPGAANREADPENDLFHAANVHRLEGEAIRDSMIQIAGGLDDKMFGPPVKIHLTEFMKGRGRPSKSGPLNGKLRRSVYLEVRRNFLSPMMLAFDTPIPFNTIGRRNRSNVPAQALILMNDPFVFEQAERWAKSLIEKDQTIEKRLEEIYLRAFGAPPTNEQTKQAIEFLDKQAKHSKIPENEIRNNVELWRDLCHVIFNVKQFIYVE